MKKINEVKGAGLGLRRSFMQSLAAIEKTPIEFLEIAPENWITVGGIRKKRLHALMERFPFVCHGLSLSLGGSQPFDLTYLKAIKTFLRSSNIICYSEHLSYTTDQGQLYDLLPLPFTQEAVRHVCARIRFVQDFLEQRIAIENVSYYAAPSTALSESEFIQAVVAESDCDLLLDVNNVYVNSINHQYDPVAFLKQLPLDRVAYVHIAGHFAQSQQLCIDTHGADIIPPVWHLLKVAYEQCGIVPTLLERDFDIPELSELFTDLKHIKQLQAQVASQTAQTVKPLRRSQIKASDADATAKRMQADCPTVLAQQQQLFTACLRDPKQHIPFELPAQRMAVYQRLVFGNLERFIANVFPVLKSFYEDDAWQQMIQSFLRHHSCQSPYFSQIGQEFIAYLATRKSNDFAEDPPFLEDLAHYEYLELVLQISQPYDNSALLTNAMTIPALLSGYPVVPPTVIVVSSRYPLHQLKPGQPIRNSGTLTHLVLYLKSGSDNVEFMEVNALYAQLLILLQENQHTSHVTGRAAIEQLAQVQQVDSKTLIDFGSKLLLSLFHQALISGLRPDH